MVTVYFNLAIQKTNSSISLAQVGNIPKHAMNVLINLCRTKVLKFIRHTQQIPL